ncbi:MAG: hypothetical protein ACRCX2_32445 [Paraclostridium sp.]
MTIDFDEIFEQVNAKMQLFVNKDADLADVAELMCSLASHASIEALKIYDEKLHGNP